jgi:hypothetical protein
MSTAALTRRPRSVVMDKRKKHGMFSISKDAIKQRQETVRRLVGQAYRAMHWLTDADRATVRSWAELEIITSQAFNNLVGEGILQKDKSRNPRRLLTDYRQLKMTQLAYEKELLMTPAARAAALGNNGGRPVDLLEHFAKTVVANEEVE